jgi:hypothetical protein
MVPEGVTILRSMTSTFRLRLINGLVGLASIVLGISLSPWWFLLTVGDFAADRWLARMEREFLLTATAILLAIDMVLADFAGWGTALPATRRVMTDALGQDRGTRVNWLDLYLPDRAELSADVLAKMAPGSALWTA